MAHVKREPADDAKGEEHNPSEAQIIKEHTGHDPSQFPPRFHAILAHEIESLHLPVSTRRFPFEPVRPPAVDSDFLRTGVGDYLFKDIDYAIIMFLFDVSDPGKMKKSSLKAWLTNKCNVPHSELEELSWPDVSEYSLYGIESECAAGRYSEGKGKRLFKKPSTVGSQEWPKDLVTLAVAEQRVGVSRSTLERAIKDGRLRSYRPEKCARNQPHKVSEAEVASHWPAKGRRT